MPSIRTIEDKTLIIVENLVNYHLINNGQYSIISSGVNPMTGNFFCMLYNPHGEKDYNYDPEKKLLSEAEARLYDANTARYFLEKDKTMAETAEIIGLKEEELKQLLSK